MQTCRSPQRSPLPKRLHSKRGSTQKSNNTQNTNHTHKHTQQPTGGAPTKQKITTIAEIAQDHKPIIFTDEIYHALTYDETKNTSIPSYPQQQNQSLHTRILKNLPQDQLETRIQRSTPQNS
nr:aminotransferase class I/II-fold pyridoxal phosphate-dependent enzyme [Candidatus Freyarchaeota archaeon]